MSMSKKDYEAIARAINERQETIGNYPNETHAYGAHCINSALRDVAQRTADYCAAQSESFDRTRFLKACGVSE